MRKIVAVILLMLMFSTAFYARENVTKRSSSFNKSTVLHDVWLDVNRMNGVFRNNGIWYFDVVAADWGLEWPKGSGLSPIFAGGQWIGAKFPNEDAPRVAGIQHSATEYQPGMILQTDQADNPRDGKYKWYTIYADGSGDWTNWPVDQGAPVDADGNPLLIGDATMFSVYNDLADHAEYGTDKLNVEVRQTVFAFNRADALGDMHFMKWQLTNKSGVDWDSTYFSIWLDPDLGDAGDDLVGCDTTLGLGFCYNATNNDQTYGAAPPATGFDFFQGPIIDNPDSTVVLPDGTVLPGKEMLKMTSFVFYNNDDSPQGNPHTGGDIWNYFRGYWRDGSRITFGGRGTDPNNPPTSFMFSGDPETGVGWLDSDEADRRFLMTTGPFQMEKWEDINGNGLPDFGEPGVQEIVAVAMVARGNDNLNSVTKLKEVDELAQLAYDLNFRLAKAPAQPNVTVSELPNHVVLTWDEASEFNDDGSPYSSADPIVAAAYGDTVIIDNTITVIDDSTYNFYGYTVYQYSDASGRDPVVVEHWDIGAQREPHPYTAQRFIRITTNRHPAVGNPGTPLVNGKEYYFGVVAEGYLEFGAPRIFTSPPRIVSVVPGYQPGVRYHAEYNDTLEVEHVVTDATKQPSDGRTVVWVVDPSSTTGQDYTVTFNEDQTWNLLRGSAVVADSIENQTGNDAYNVMDGLMVKVMGPDPGINTSIPGPFGDIEGLNGWDWQGNRWLSWGPDWGGETWFGSWGNGASFFGSTLSASDYVDVNLQFAGGDKASEPERWSRGYVYRRDMGYAFVGMGDVPLSAWDISDTTNPRRLNVCFVENDPMPSLNDPNNLIPANNVWDLGWHEMPGDTGFAELGGREYLFIMLSDYDTSGVYDDVNWGPAADVLYAYWPGPRGSQPYLDGQFDLQFFASKVNATWDQFKFTAPSAATVTTSNLQKDIEKINVVPNPYYGYHSGELNPFERWVQFTNLPAKSTIRIFDLAGNLVRKLGPTNGTSPFLKWDMKNEYRLPVASGVYIYHVEVPNVGEKIGKMAIFTPNERIDVY